MAFAPEISSRGQETVLLVEDEDMVRSLARRLLHKNGYHVLEASHGEEALEVDAQHAESIHLLLTDVVMPGMNGPDLAERLVAHRPQIRVVYMSGYTDTIFEDRGILQKGVVFLQKPFSADSLTRKVREALDARQEEQA